LLPQHTNLATKLTATVKTECAEQTKKSNSAVHKRHCTATKLRQNKRHA